MNKSQPSENQPLKDYILERIASHPQQRITFAEYMEIVLYQPELGYYATNQVNIGKSGDFFTASNLSADFGELLAEQFVEMWEILKCPSVFQVVEMGAGSGLLAQDILTYVNLKYPRFFQSLEYLIIETASGLIEAQKQRLSSWLNSAKVSWQAWETIGDRSIVGCCFSNELVDAFPVSQIILKQGQLQEIYVTADLEKNWIEIADTPSTSRLLDYFEFNQIPILSESYPEGYRSEVNLAALDWLETVTTKLQRGYLLTLDYGYPAPRYYSPYRHSGTLQCYYQHQRHNNPYLNIGRQDITAHVNFTALERYGDRCGLQQLGFTQQGLFLMALGIGDRLNALRDANLSLEQTLRRRDALHQLIDPAGLGNFGVLVQAKGLSEEQKARSLKGLKIPT